MVPRHATALERRVIERIVSHCAAYGVRVKFANVQRFGKRYQSSGGYSPTHGISVATRSRRWIETLVHEYCHFLQDIEGTAWFHAAREDHKWITWENWILGESDPSPARILDCVRTIQECELDCERRVVALVKRWRLPWNLNSYRQSANVYVLSYEAMRLTRASDDKMFASRCVQLLRAVPDRRFVRRNHLHILPPGFLAAFCRYCIK